MWRRLGPQIRAGFDKKGKEKHYCAAQGRLVYCCRFQAVCLKMGERVMDQNQLRLLAIASQLGFGIAGPLIVFIVGGIFLDKKVGTSPLFLLIGVVFGMIGAGYAIFDLVKKLPSGRKAPKRPDEPA
jgi:hypothetical protein